MNKEKILNIIGKIPASRVLVAGDVGLDSYLVGTVKRISPEAPVPVVEVIDEYNRLGLAANVVNNVNALGGKSNIIGVIGNDDSAKLLIDEIERLDINAKNLVVDDTRMTTSKTRVLASRRHHVVRLDRENVTYMSSDTRLKIIDSFDKLISDSDIVILQDYGKGFFKDDLMPLLTEKCNNAGIPVVIDPCRNSLVDIYKNATIFKPNLEEAQMLSGIYIESDDDLYKCGYTLLERLGNKYIVITRGEKGMTVFSESREPVTIPSFALEVYDVSGAGDTVVAALALAYSSGASITDCMYFANIAAAIVVAKVGTSVATPGEIVHFLDEHHVR